MPEDEAIRTSRVGRAFELAKLAAAVSKDLATGRATRLLSARNDAERAKELDALLGEQVAEETFKVLSKLKGLALKVGQLMATSADLVPEDYRPAVRRVLGRLYDRATPLAFEAVRGVVEKDLGRPIALAFAKFDETPFAAASIGQVHRAELPSGEPVAVKVQYPDVATAIEGDLKNLALVKAVIAPILRTDVDQTFEDVRARIQDECDYALEARRLERFQAIWKGDPEVRIPRVHLSHSGPRTLTMELATGLTFSQLLERPHEERSRAGATLYRFVYRSCLVHGLLYADPHPGNFLFLPDEGRTWVLDLGCVQELELEFLALTRRMHRAAMDGKPEVVRATFSEALGIQPSEAELELLDRFVIDYVYRPFAKDAEFEYGDAYVRELIDWGVAGAKQALFNLAGKGTRDPKRKGVVWLNRILLGLNNLLAALHARARFHAIHRAILDEADGPRR